MRTQRVEQDLVEDGAVAPPFPSGGWRVPARVRLENGKLFAEWSAGPWKRVFPEIGMLARFIALADVVKPNRFVAFAERWGLLGLCKHGEGPLHAGGWGMELGMFCPTFFDRDWDGGEAIEWWQNQAASAGRIVREIARATLRGQEQWSEWVEVYPELEDDAPPQLDLVREVERWLRAGGVRPRLAFANSPGRDVAPTLTFDGAGLFGALSVQLMLAAWRGDQMIPCREPGCPSLGDLRGRRAAPYCAEHRVAAIGTTRSARFRAAHPGYYTNEQRTLRAARTQATGRPRRSSSNHPPG